MLSQKFATPLVLEPQPSRSLLACVLVGHAVFVVLFGIAAPALPWLVVAGAAALLSLHWIWRAHFDPGNGMYVRRATWDCDGGWSIVCGDGRRFEPCLGPSGICCPALVVLNFELGPWRKRTLVLVADSLPPEILRRLRMRLRLSAR